MFPTAVRNAHASTAEILPTFAFNMEHATSIMESVRVQQASAAMTAQNLCVELYRMEKIVRRRPKANKGVNARKDGRA